MSKMAHGQNLGDGVFGIMTGGLMMRLHYRTLMLLRAVSPQMSCSWKNSPSPVSRTETFFCVD
uniref:Uncharacterized protein n=1 Tax=Anguilla anguilla TaxID=7936 RepID=A0A0E9VUQ4_ANGAN